MILRSLQLKWDHENGSMEWALLYASAVSEWSVLSQRIWDATAKTGAVCLPSIPSLDTGHDSVLFLTSGGSNSNSCLQGWVSQVLLMRGPPLLIQVTTKESRWNSNRTFPGSPGKEVPSSQKYLLNWQNISLELERAILLRLWELLPEKKINTEEERAKRERDRFLTTSLEHREAAVPEETPNWTSWEPINCFFFFLNRSQLEFCHLSLKEGPEVNPSTEMWIFPLNISWKSSTFT